MGAIVDVLFLGADEIKAIRKRYPDCLLTGMSSPDRGPRRYRLIVPGEESCDESYYDFLVDNMIALSSANFRSRLDSDARFRERMKARAAALKDASDKAPAT